MSSNQEGSGSTARSNKASCNKPKFKTVFTANKSTLGTGPRTQADHNNVVDDKQKPQRGIGNSESKSKSSARGKPKFITVGLRNKSILSTGPKRRRSSNNAFSYHISSDEQKMFNYHQKPMRDVGNSDKKLLLTNARVYLQNRQNHGPETKYNYPEATNMRYGWIHSSQVNASKSESKVDNNVK